MSGNQAEPFRLASCFPPVTAKLVRRIQALEFVDMRELLPDNMALAERLEALPARLGNSAPRIIAEQREVPSLLTWVSCFATYVAVVAQAHPHRVTDMLAYMRLLIREAHKHGGQGWLTYDAVFRRNRHGMSEPWSHLDPSLHSAYILGQGTSPRIPCKHCNEADHIAEGCALAPTVAPTKPSRERETVFQFPRPPYKRPAQASPTTDRPKPICISWNKGKCAYPGACSFLHICPFCDTREHRAVDCPHAPPDSPYRQAQPTRRRLGQNLSAGLSTSPGTDRH